MHDTAYAIGAAAIRAYVPLGGIIVEIGSADLNGSLRAATTQDVTYVGIDLQAGASVDIVVGANAKLPIATGSADFVIASSILEHDEAFWETFIEACRITKPGGFVYINVPSNGKVHNYPVDCWRFYPGAGRALAKYSRKTAWEVMLVESFVADRQADCWNDFVAVFQRGCLTSDCPRMSELFSCRNVQTDTSANEMFSESWPEDMILIQSLRDRVEQLERACQLYEIVREQADEASQQFTSRVYQSPYLKSEFIPRTFNPIRYLALHRDLFEARVDPYEHYILHGRFEKRSF